MTNEQIIEYLRAYNMRETPTPETDAAWESVPTVGGVTPFRDWAYAMYEHARRMELERDEFLGRLTALELRMPEELARLEREVLEQACLLEMGAERELVMLGQIARLKREIAKCLTNQTKTNTM
jgi:hypothetical protein